MSPAVRKAPAAKKAPAAVEVVGETPSQASPPNRTEVTGVDLAYVNLPDGTVLDVREGQTLPADVSDAERDRLDALGVFGEHRRVGIARRLAEDVANGLASVRMATGTTVVAAPDRDDDDVDDDEVDEPLTPIVDPSVEA